jgi:hypothetical protein
MLPIPFSNSYLGNIVGHPLDNDICGQSRNFLSNPSYLAVAKRNNTIEEK